MTKKLFFSLLAIMMCNIWCNAQVVVNSELEKELFKSRVKLVEGFMRRFNCKEILHTIDTTKANYKLQNILALFDGLLFGTKDVNDSLYKTAQSFANDVLESNTKLNYADTTWLAIAPCHGQLKGKDVDFVLFLNVEKYDTLSYKWVIAKAQGEVFKLKPSFTSKELLITPLDHETNFMELNNITTQKDDWILNYAQKQYELDETAVFYTYVYNGMLDIEYVRDLQFMFLQVPGWTFTIQDFDRQTKNAGWLITSFARMNDNDKKKFLDNVYNQK